MADSKGGPVKPPVLDLTARDSAEPVKDTKPVPMSDPAKPAAPIDAVKPAMVTDAPKPVPKPEPAKADTKPEAKPAVTKTRSDDDDEGGFAFGAMLAGAVLGLGAAYGLAYFGYWPAPKAAIAAADPRLAQYDKALPELQTQIATATSELATLTGRVKTLESTPAKAAPATAVGAAPDLTAINADIASLKDQIGKVAAPPPATDLSGVTGDIAALKSSLTEIGARVGTTEASISKLDTDVAKTSATLAAQPSNISAVLQLPLILSGLETAFANGRPYEIELAALNAGMPDAKVPAEITNAAKTGLTRADIIAQRFAQLLPDILAGRPADPNASWQDSAGNWFRSLLALRPTGAVEGDDPEAVVSRLEVAIGRRDFVTAQALMGKLPAPMVAAAAELPAAIAAQATAAQLLQTLRDAAMSEAGK